MRVEQGVVAALVADVTVGSVAGDRIYHMQAPQEATTPYVTYQRVGTGRGTILDGVDTMTEVRIQLDCWADSVADSKALADAVRGVLDDVKGDLGGLSPRVQVQFGRLESEYDFADVDGDYERRRVALDFVFTLHE
jgi:hypothetical protein